MAQKYANAHTRKIVVKNSQKSQVNTDIVPEMIPFNPGNILRSPGNEGVQP